MIDVPARTEDATAAFATAALRAGGAIGPDTAVTDVEHEPIGVGVGIVGQLARLSLRYDGPAANAPPSVVVKLPSHLPENRAVGDHFNFYERECRFYDQIGGKVPVRTPRCYWNQVDIDRQAFGLLLEDLTDRTSVSQVDGVDRDRAALALEALAVLHATWWASPVLDGLTWMPRVVDPVNLAAGQQYRDAWPSFVERVGEVLPDGALAFGERAQRVFEELMQADFDSTPTTVCHGDFRIDNLLFDDAAPRPDQVAVLDWQIAMKASGVSDVAYFLAGSMDVEERRANERELLRLWWEALGPQEGYAFEQAWTDYRRAMVLTTVYGVTAAGAMDPSNERGRELVAAMSVRSFTACLDLESDDLLP